jgi:hypothetical protein
MPSVLTEHFKTMQIFPRRSFLIIVSSLFHIHSTAVRLLVAASSLCRCCVRLRRTSIFSFFHSAGLLKLLVATCITGLHLAPRVQYRATGLA